MINSIAMPHRRLCFVLLTAGLSVSLPLLAFAGGAAIKLEAGAPKVTGAQAGAHGGGVKKEAKTTLANNSAEAGQLRQAYGILETADHDYKGHRREAMKQIEDATKKFGVTLRGDGRGHEPQRTSDEALHVALGILSNITGAVRGEGLAHIEGAIRQLETALAIK